MEAAKGYKGEKEDGQIWNEVFAPVAKDEGYEVSFDDFKEFMDQIVSEDEISEDELQAVAGGVSLCFFIGGGTKVEAAAEYTSGDLHRFLGVGACAYLGVGFFAFGEDNVGS